jgi:hypothetical protein
LGIWLAGQAPTVVFGARWAMFGGLFLLPCFRIGEALLQRFHHVDHASRAWLVFGDDRLPLLLGFDQRFQIFLELLTSACLSFTSLLGFSVAGDFANFVGVIHGVDQTIIARANKNRVLALVRGHLINGRDRKRRFPQGLKPCLRPFECRS